MEQVLSVKTRSIRPESTRHKFLPKRKSPISSLFTETLIGMAGVRAASASWLHSHGTGPLVFPFGLSTYLTNPQRCLLYSTKDFADGETARAIRLAVEDLVDYAENEELRQEHYNFQRNECEDLVSKGANPIRVIQVELDWLHSKLVDLQSLREGK
jgi:hypothetical protein